MSIIASLQTLAARRYDVVTDNVSTKVKSASLCLKLLCMYIDFTIHDMRRPGFGSGMYECGNPYP